MSLLDGLNVGEREFARPRRQQQAQQQAPQQAPQQQQASQQQQQQRQLEVINDLLISYNNNIRDYQRNISMLASIIYLQNSNTRQQSRPSTPRRTTPAEQPSPARPPRNVPSSFNYYMQPNNQERVYYTSNIWRNFPNMDVPSPTTPSPLNNREFENGTRSIVFSEENQSDISDAVCPISLEPHQYGDLLCEITGCHHIFNQANLVNWFRRSHLCPVCRYNVRTNAPQPASPPQEPIDLARPLQNDHYYSDLLRSLQGAENTTNDEDVPDNVSVD